MFDKGSGFMNYSISYRKKNNSWQYIISYKDNRGKWKQKSKQGFPLTRLGKKRAQDVAMEEIKNLQVIIQNNINNDYEDITFYEYAQEHINHLKLYLEENTILSYNRALKKFKGLYDIELSKITSVAVQKCIDELVEYGYSYTSLKLYIAFLNIIFDTAINKHKIINTNPLKNVDIPKMKDHKEKRALNKSEFNDLLSKIKNPKYYLITRIAGECGLRIGEILGLTWNDINEVNCIISVNKQWKLLKNGQHGFGTLKSKNSKRNVIVPIKLMNYIIKYKNENPINLDNRILRYKSTSAVGTSLMRYYNKLGYAISVHELRHTYATQLIAAGTDWETAASLLGHDVEQTMHTYAHVTQDMMDNAKSIINKIF